MRPGDAMRCDGTENCIILQRIDQPSALAGLYAGRWAAGPVGRQGRARARCLYLVSIFHQSDFTTFSPQAQPTPPEEEGATRQGKTKKVGASNKPYLQSEELETEWTYSICKEHRPHAMTKTRATTCRTHLGRFIDCAWLNASTPSTARSLAHAIWPCQLLAGSYRA